MAALDEFILTSEIVKEISEKENLGKLLKRHEKLWFSNIRGIRKAGVTFAMTEDEFEEYVKCKMSVNYFAEKYCKIKLEDGTIGNMKLRNYQKDIMNLYTKNRYSILMASRQTGKCNSFNTSVLLLDETTKETYEVPFCEVYYSTIEQVRKLKISERLKLFLYRLYIKIS
jgi:hypothetical protein